MAVDHQNGIFRGETDVVEKIGGRPPQALDEFIRRTLFSHHRWFAVKCVHCSFPKYTLSGSHEIQLRRGQPTSCNARFPHGRVVRCRW